MDLPYSFVDSIAKMVPNELNITIDKALVENPELTPKDAMEFSARLTKGYKWDLFLFDLSFWYWHLLGLLTFGIARVLFVQPYYYLAKSGWHIYLFRMADELSDADINAYRAQNAERNGKR